MDFKELLHKLYEKETTPGAYLNNLAEKKDLFYLDAPIPEEGERDEFLEEVASYVVKRAEKMNFEDDEDITAHYAIFYNEELEGEPEEETTIVAFPYSKSPYPLVDSNFIWCRYDDRAGLFIDIYGLAGAMKQGTEYLHMKVLQELYNFSRDARWVLGDKYDEEIEKMREEVDNFDFDTKI